MALVVFVFAAIGMLAEGLQKTLVQTGSPTTWWCCARVQTARWTAGWNATRQRWSRPLRTSPPTERVSRSWRGRR
jgi:hypothetical protein